MKVALCLYGQPRFLGNPKGIQSHRKHIMDKYDTDVFCHFWHDPNLDFFEKSDFSKAPGGRKEKYEAPVHKDADKIISKLYSPKIMKQDKPKFFSPPSPLPEVFKKYPAFSDVNFSNLKSQMYSWQRVLELFSENDDGNYDFVIVSRYDNDIKTFSNLETLSKGGNYAHATYDITILNPKICAQLKPFDRFDEITPIVPSFNAAFWKIAEIKKAGASCAETHAWKFDLIRSE